MNEDPILTPNLQHVTSRSEKRKKGVEIKLYSGA